MIKKVLLTCLGVYKKAISPYVPRSCRYTPTCSEYAREAVEAFGVLKGLRVSILRVLRCHPFSRGGYDPVENNRRGRK
ncbi:MAG: membrane protein insertion efficiency factor YidD [Candidatus Omnitrophota bacterium]